MKNNIKDVLNKINLNKSGTFKNHFYVIDLENSDEYARVYSLLDEVAINTEYPAFTKNSNNSTVKITNYFEIDVNEVKYNIFLMADFENDRYYLKIDELGDE